MKAFYTLIFSVLLFTSCKKTKEKLAEDAVISAMTNGQWVMTEFTVNGTDNTTDFTGYKFQYYKDRTVDAIKNGVVEKKGIWDADALARTTQANFTNVSNPLLLINGTWNINDSGWTFVKATQTAGSTVKTLRLDKL
jgi:hypothetical protein